MHSKKELRMFLGIFSPQKVFSEKNLTIEKISWKRVSEEFEFHFEIFESRQLQLQATSIYF